MLVHMYISVGGEGRGQGISFFFITSYNLCFIPYTLCVTRLDNVKYGYTSYKIVPLLGVLMRVRPWIY